MEQLNIPRIFSGHETFPLRQSWLGKLNNIAINSMILKDKFSDEALIGELGVGKNMVASMRHWGLACGMLEEVEDQYRLSTYFDLLFRADYMDRGEGQKHYPALDPYLERSDSVWFVHWRLSAFPTRSTTWFWLFNRISAPTFTRDDIQQSIAAYLVAANAKVSDTTLQRDVETCIRSYVPKLDAKGAVEDASDSFLVELGLIREEQRGVYAFKRGPKPTLSQGFFAFCLAEYWDRYHRASNQLSFDLIAYADHSPGKVFKLDDDSLMDYIDRIEDSTDGLYRWSSTAGVRQLVKDERILAKLRGSVGSNYLVNLFHRAYG